MGLKILQLYPSKGQVSRDFGSLGTLGNFHGAYTFFVHDGISVLCVRLRKKQTIGVMLKIYHIYW